MQKNNSTPNKKKPCKKGLFLCTTPAETNLGGGGETRVRTVNTPESRDDWYWAEVIEREQREESMRNFNY